MINLSPRLLAISDFIDNNSHIVDIGCDHGLLDVYLVGCKNCLATLIDVSDYIINRAKKNFLDNNITSNALFIKGNGFNDLSLNKEDTLILSGMGTGTILKIIDANRVNRVIVQTNTEVYDLRHDLSLMGYFINREKIVFDKKYCVIIEFIKGNISYSEIELLLGPYLLNNRNDVFNDYVSFLKKYYINELNYSIKFNKEDKKLLEERLEIVSSILD